jgi:Zn-finger protein
MPKNSSYVPSKIQTTCECFICHKPYNLARHHCIHGRGLRQLAEEDGLWVWLCVKCHSDLHDKPDHPHDAELKKLAQQTFVYEFQKKGVSEEIARDYFRQRYGRFYD